MNDNSLHPSRWASIKVIEAVDNGLITWEELARACLDHLGEYEINQMGKLELGIEDELDDGEDWK